jgi:hypothetical protein
MNTKLVKLRHRMFKLRRAIDSEPPSLFRNELESTYQSVRREYERIKHEEVQRYKQVDLEE